MARWGDVVFNALHAAFELVETHVHVLRVLVAKNPEAIDEPSKDGGCDGGA